MTNTQAHVGDDLPMPTHVWHRHPNESREAYDAFWAYLTLEADRSYAKVAKKLGKSEQLITRWGRTHKWVRRSYFYDCEQDRIRLVAHRDELRKMMARHADTAKVMNGKLVQRLKQIDVASLKPNELVNWFRVSVEIERKSRGAQSLMRVPNRRMPDEEDGGGSPGA